MNSKVLEDKYLCFPCYVTHALGKAGEGKIALSVKILDSSVLFLVEYVRLRFWSLTKA